MLFNTTLDSDYSSLDITCFNVLLFNENSEQPYESYSFIKRYLHRWAIKHNVTYNWLSNILRD